MALIVVGCGGGQPSWRREEARGRLAVLPAESDAHPRLAEALNRLLPQMAVPGVTERIQPKVTLEVVQLSIECVDATSECYTQVGQSLSADYLLFAVVSDQRPGVSVTLTLFDVADGRAVREEAGAFQGERQALEGLEALVKRMEADGPP